MCFCNLLAFKQLHQPRCYPDVYVGLARRPHERFHNPMQQQAPSGAFSLFCVPIGREATMTRNYYSEIKLHVVWHTKNSTPRRERP
jgi:hypothetical protein